MKLFKVGDKVRHENFPGIIYEVKLEFLDGSYRIEPLNADMGKAIAYATKEKMTLIRRTDDDSQNIIKRFWDMKAKEQNNDVAFFKQLADVRCNSDTHSPDAFNEVARELFGMTVKEAQMLYEKYRRIAVGWWNWSEENEEETIDILTKAKQVLDHSMRLNPADKWRSIESFLGREGNYDDRNRIGVWAKYEGKEPQLFELWINSPKCLAMLHDMEQREDVQVLCIVPWVDSIYDATRENCLNDLGDKGRMQVYDGDIFVLFNKGVDDYWNRPSENGVYVCRWGAYRRLLYTVGRGYLTIDKEANVASTEDEDDEYGNVFCYDKHRWNSHIMTMDHKWKRIGNIHADVTLLMEKKEG